jgi:hypothetical protein
MPRAENWFFIDESPEKGIHGLKITQWVWPIEREVLWGLLGGCPIFSPVRGELGADVGGGCTDRGQELHLVWTEISSPTHPPTHWLGGQAVGLSPEGQLAWAWRPAGQAR